MSLVESFTLNKRRTLSHFERKEYVTRTQIVGSDTDIVFCYQSALWVSGECKIVGRTLSLSLSAQYC